MATPALRVAAALSVLCCAATAQGEGLRLISPTGNNTTQLVDSQGVVVHTWPGTNSVTVHLLDDGSLLRGAVEPTAGLNGATGRLERLSFDGALTWSMLVDSPSRAMHHDIEPMPNGNVLVFAWDRMDVSDAIAAGRDPALITGTRWEPDSILEIQPTGPATGTVVWEWHFRDHLIQDFDATKANFGVVGDHPELLDVNFPPVVVSNGDWNHCNGLDYDPVNDWIVLSARPQSEIYLIDHSTTTAEAAGHAGGLRGKGGDILWRWGNPEAYDAGTLFDRQLFFQHDPRFVEQGFPGAGNITLFNNSYTATQSAIFELELPVDGSGSPFVDQVTGRFGPAQPTWSYTDPAFFSEFVSSAQRLRNGNTLVCSGQQQWLFEVSPAGQVVWQYTWPGSAFLFQAHAVERRLWADRDTLSVSGGIVGFRHLSDTAYAGSSYLLLGALTGPGSSVLSNGVVLPLTIDPLTLAMAENPNFGLFVDTFAPVAANGSDASWMVLPGGVVPPWLVGLPLAFSRLLLDPSVAPIAASNPVVVTLAP